MSIPFQALAVLPIGQKRREEEPQLGHQGDSLVPRHTTPCQLQACKAAAVDSAMHSPAHKIIFQIRFLVLINLYYCNGLLTPHKRWKEVCETLAACFAFIEGGALLKCILMGIEISQKDWLNTLSGLFSVIKIIYGRAWGIESTMALERKQIIPIIQSYCSLLPKLAWRRVKHT